MEDPNEGTSSEYKTLFYAVQLKATDAAQTLRAMGSRLTDNEIKSMTNEQLNIFCMTEKLFEQIGSVHLFHLLKIVNQNYNSLMVLLLQKIQKLTQKIYSIQRSATEQKEPTPPSAESEITAHQNLILQSNKIKKLGGVNLYNENYARYLEDNRILEQLNFEKEQKVRQKKQSLLRSLIYEELNHKTDVQGETQPNDQIAKYIIQTKNKDSVYNYIPYQSELQQILTFFQNSQTEANDFITKRNNQDRTSKQSNRFSFADFQRQIQMQNSEFKKQAMKTLQAFIERLKQKQKTIEKYVSQKQEFFRILEQKLKARQQKQVQTDFQFSHFLRQCQAEKRDILIKCEVLQNLKISESSYIQRQNIYKSQISLRNAQIDRLDGQIKQFQCVIYNLKKQVRQQKSRKNIYIKDQIQLLPTVSQSIQSAIKPKTEQPIANEDTIEEKSLLHSTNGMRTSTNRSHNWHRKASNDTTSFYSSNQYDSDYHQSDSLNRPRRLIKHNIQNIKSEIKSVDFQDTNRQSIGNKQSLFSKLKSSELAIQTEEKYRNSIGIESASQLPILQSKDNSKLKQTDKNIQTISNIDKPQKSQKMIPALKKKGTAINMLKKSFNQRSNPPIQPKTASEVHLVSNKSQKKANFNQNETIQNKQKQLQSLNLSANIIQNDKHSRNNVQQNKKKIYQIVQVNQQYAEQQRESARKSYKSQHKFETISCSQKSMTYNTDKIQKIIQQYNKQKIQNKFSYNSLYNLTLEPFKINQKFIQMQNSKHSQLNNNKNPKTQAQNMIKRQQILTDILKYFDHIPKIDSSLNNLKRQRLMDCKKKLLQTYHSKILSPNQIQDVVAVLNFSTKKYLNPHQKSHQNSPSKTNNNIIINSNRNSLPQREDHKNKTTFSSNKTQYVQQFWQRHNSFSQQKYVESNEQLTNQDNLLDLIKFQSFDGDFPKKFERMHRGCKQGPVCTHITKYLQVIMKQIDQIKQRNKHHLTLHIQNIGNKIPAENEIKNGVKSHQSSMMSTKQASIYSKQNILIVKDPTFKCKSLHKFKNSKNTLFPFIKDSKSSLHSVNK